MSLGSPRARQRIGLGLIVLGGIGLRLLPADRVFGVAFVNFQGDAWYHLRRLDWHLANFPRTLTGDPYADGAYIALPPLFDFLLSFFVLLAGWPSPGSYPADVAAAVAPAVMGGLVALPTFFLARRIFSRAAAWISALLAVAIGGPFMARSFVGVADHHVAEVLFTSATLALLAAALQEVDGGVVTRRAVTRAVGSGLALGAYFITWSGAAFIVPALALGIAVDSLRDCAAARRPGARFGVLGIASGVAFTIFVLFQPTGMYRYGLQFMALGGLLAFCLGGRVLLAAFQRVLPPRLVVAGAVLLAGLAAALALRTPAGAEFLPELHRVMGGGAATVSETRPLLSLAPNAWLAIRMVFGWSALALAILPALVLYSVRSGTSGLALFLCWAGLTTAATFGQSRFGYYLSPNLALLAGWALGWLWERGRVSRAAARGLLILYLLIEMPNTAAALRNDEGMPVGWHQALSWLRRGSAEPLGEPDGYFASYESKPKAGATVLTWWDYGYWVMRVGRRVPVSNPTQARAELAGRLLTAPLGEPIERDLEAARVRHVIVADTMLFGRAGPSGLFPAMATWARRDMSRYLIQAVETGKDGKDQPVWLFLPDYFSSLAVHLYEFGGRATRASDVSVVTLSRNGPGPVWVAASKPFPDFPSAKRYRDSLGPGLHVVASRDPRKSCVDLPGRPGFDLAFETREVSDGEHGRSAVRVFSYTPGAVKASGSGPNR